MGKSGPGTVRVQDEEIQRRVGLGRSPPPLAILPDGDLLGLQSKKEPSPIPGPPPDRVGPQRGPERDPVGRVGGVDCHDLRPISIDDPATDLREQVFGVLNRGPNGGLSVGTPGHSHAGDPPGDKREDDQAEDVSVNVTRRRARQRS